MRISDWSSDVCSSDLQDADGRGRPRGASRPPDPLQLQVERPRRGRPAVRDPQSIGPRQREARRRSEEHTSELQSLMRISYAVFCLKKKTTTILDPTKTTESNTHDATQATHAKHSYNHQH